jgi:hypothetical protein
MKTNIAFAILAVSSCFVSCKKKQPENVPVPKAEPPPQTAAAASTAPVFSQNPLTAPGNYLKTTVGHVKEAKDARALYEKTAKDGLKSLDLNNTGGN